jgi:multiple antibiotic resistance protein
MFIQDLTHFFGVVVLVVAALLPIVDPIGSVPVFLAMTPGADRNTRSWLAGQIGINSFLLLVGAMLIGSLVLRAFGLSIPVVQFAGGLVLCALGWNLLSTSGSAPRSETPMDPDITAKAFYPLTLPVTVDPGSLAVALALGAHHSASIETLAVTVTAGVTGVALVALTVWLTYRYADRVSSWIGQSRMMVILRLMAFVTLCIGVQISWTGVKGMLTDLPQFAPAVTRGAT